MTRSTAVAVTLLWMTCALAGCGDERGEGQAGAAGSTGGMGGGTAMPDSGPPAPIGTSPRQFTAMNVATLACNAVTAGQEGVVCEGVDEYTECALAACAPADLIACYGANYAQNDTNGGACDAFVDCMVGSPDHCSNDCVPDPACDECAATRLQCLLLAVCEPPTCSGAGD